MSKQINENKYGKLYLASYKLAIVAEVEREGELLKMVCERHGLDQSRVRAWMNKYGSSEYLGSRPKRHSLSEKNTIVREVLSGRLTAREAQLKYQVGCPETVYLWLRQYKKSQQSLTEVSSAAVTDTGSEMHNEMQKELEMARLKIRALEVMVDIASDQFKVDIRKKFGAKQ